MSANYVIRNNGVMSAQGDPPVDRDGRSGETEATDANLSKSVVSSGSTFTVADY